MENIENMTLEECLIVEQESAELCTKHLMKNRSLFDFWESIKSKASKRADNLILHSAVESVEERGEL